MLPYQAIGTTIFRFLSDARMEQQYMLNNKYAADAEVEVDHAIGYRNYQHFAANF